MAKELPYFKFYPSEWVTGDITLCSLSAQGLFTNICSFYWMKNCSISLANAKQRFSKDLASLNELLEQKILKVDSHENIIINFLDEQMNEFTNISEKRAKSGSEGGKAKAKQMLKFATAKRSNKDKDKEENKNKIIIPTLEEVKIYCTERKNDVDPNKWFNFYSAKGWMIGKSKMKDWQAAVRTWEKNNDTSQKQQLAR